MAEGTIADVLAGAARWSITEGDSALVLPSIPDASIHAVVASGCDDKIEVDPVPFHEHVARVAERNDVGHGVRIVRILEQGHGREVVDVVKFTGRRRCGASAALVPVAGPRGLSDLAPVGAVVRWVTTAPCRILVSFAVCVAAVERAELEATDGGASVVCIVERGSAVRTHGRMKGPLPLRLARRCNLRGLTFRRVGVRPHDYSLGRPGRSAFVVAGARTEHGSVFGYSKLRRAFVHGRATRSALEVKRVLLFLDGPSRVHTRFRTKSSGLVLNSCGSNHENDRAMFARPFGHCRHETSLARRAFMCNK